jgi:hypothetical protein
MQLLANTLEADPQAAAALQFLLAQNYLDMGTAIGQSESSKVLFLDPRSVIGTIEGMKDVLDQPRSS